MTTTTRGIIVGNQIAALEGVESEIADFAAIAPVGQIVNGSTAGGQGLWAIIRPARALTTAERNRLRAAGFRYGRHGLGEANDGTTSNLGWRKST